MLLERYSTGSDNRSVHAFKYDGELTQGVLDMMGTSLLHAYSPDDIPGEKRRSLGVRVKGGGMKLLFEGDYLILCDDGQWEVWDDFGFRSTFGESSSSGKVPWTRVGLSLLTLAEMASKSLMDEKLWTIHADTGITLTGKATLTWSGGKHHVTFKGSPRREVPLDRVTGLHRTPDMKSCPVCTP